jgi:ribose-phosphate pyrophosphokinase
VENGRNPIVAHEYMGESVEGKNIIIVDDIIGSGESILDLMRELKKRGANKIIVICTFAWFTDGTTGFDEMYRDGVLHRLYTTNLCYVKDEVRNAPWCTEVDLTMNLARIVDYLNYDKSISKLLDMTPKI